MSKNPYEGDFENADPPNLLTDPFSSKVKCLGCGNIVSDMGSKGHAATCTLLHMRRQLRAKHTRPKR